MEPNGAPMETDEERDDDVVAEIDVLLTDELKSVYLVQYPTKPSREPPFRPDEITSIKFKPEREELQIQLALNTRGPDFDRRKSEALATAANVGIPVPYFETDLVDRQLMESSKPIGNDHDETLAIGRFERLLDDDGNYLRSVLHLTPIKNVLQMETSCEYLDNHGRQKTEESVDTKPITVRFAGRESDRVKAIRQRAFSQIVKNSKEEQFLNMGYRDINSPEADQLRMQMLCVNPETDNSVIFNADKTTYASQLTSKRATTGETESLKTVFSKPLSEQVSYIMCNAKILPFDRILSVLAADKTQLLRTVQQCACLVQGNWVVKSEVLFPKESCSDLLGVPGDIMRRSRNHLLIQLNNSIEVSRQELAETIRLPFEELDDLMKQLTDHVGRDRWRLKFERDEDFLRDNPDIVGRQKLIWDALESSLKQEFKEAREARTEVKPARKRKTSKSVEAS